MGLISEPAFTLPEMAFLEVAVELLRDDGQPLRTREMSKRVLVRNLVATSGKASEATISAALYRAPPEAAVRREFLAGRARAARWSVRWFYMADRATTTAAGRRSPAGAVRTSREPSAGRVSE